MTQKLYTPEQVAEYLGVCEYTVRRLVDKKLLGCVFFNRMRRFTQAHLDEFLKNAANRAPRKHTPPPPAPNLAKTWNKVGEEIQETKPLLWVALENTELVKLNRRHGVAIVRQPNKEWIAVLQTDRARFALQNALKNALGQPFKIEVSGAT